MSKQLQQSCFHLFTDGNGFFMVTEGNKVIFEDKPNTSYRFHLDTDVRATFEAGCLAEWVLRLQDEGIIKEDFTIDN